MNKILDKKEIKIVWNNCCINHNNTPEESGEYLVIYRGEFEILPFFKKGDVIERSPMQERISEKYGIVVQTIATENSFYKEDGKIFGKVVVEAWTKLPDNISDFLNIFVDKGIE